MTKEKKSLESKAKKQTNKNFHTKYCGLFSLSKGFSNQPDSIPAISSVRKDS